MKFGCPGRLQKKNLFQIEDVIIVKFVNEVWSEFMFFVMYIYIYRYS